MEGEQDRDLIYGAAFWIIRNILIVEYNETQYAQNVVYTSQRYGRFMDVETFVCVLERFN